MASRLPNAESRVSHSPRRRSRFPTGRDSQSDDESRHGTLRLLHKVSALAPLAVGYGAFQAVLSSLPPSLSYADLHYLCSVACGIAAGGVTGCAVLWARLSSAKDSAATRALVPGIHDRGARHRPDTMSLFRTAYLALLGSLVTFDDPALGRLTGWPHFFHEAEASYRPTPYGTAYGLKLAVVLGDQDGRLDRASLGDTLWKLRRPDGGWASRTQGSVGRPEVTALVLGALASVGSDSTRLAEAGAHLESMIGTGNDPVAITSTYIVSALIRELARIRPQSPLLTQLRTNLLAGAVQDPQQENLLCWGPSLDTGNSQAPVPTSAHTAMAVLALSRARLVATDGARSQSALEQGARWLTRDRNLENQTEQIRRFVTEDHWESLTVRLFTSAWVSKAVLAVGTDIPGASDLLEEAVARVIHAQHDGIWEWENSERPIWMSYQGASTVRAYALCRWTPP